MKKILIGILIILLCVMAYFAIFKGISIGNFEILSVEQIQTENEKLEKEIAQTETLMHSTYTSQTEQLEKSVSSLLTAKEEYKDLENVSTEGEIAEATKQEVYKIEYLWTRIGSHATAEGVTLKLDVETGTTGESEVKNLSFTVSGSYIAIINFVTAIEDDSELGFRIENFKILPGSDASGRQGTFMVKNVRVQQESTTTNVTTTQTNTETDTDVNINTNIDTTNTTNSTNTTNNADNTGNTTTTTTTTDTTTSNTTNTMDMSSNEAMAQ